MAAQNDLVLDQQEGGNVEGNRTPILDMLVVIWPSYCGSSLP
jgi:hypothetical protein